MKNSTKKLFGPSCFDAVDLASRLCFFLGFQYIFIFGSIMQAVVISIRYPRVLFSLLSFFSFLSVYSKCDVHILVIVVPL